MSVTERPDLDALFEPFDGTEAPGLTVGVNREGRPLYRRAFGLANLEHGVPNTLRTRMAVGSVTKQFTSFAALLLSEEGRLGLDEGIRAFLPELPVLEGEATLRQLLNHTGGYRCILDAAFADGFALKPAGAALASQARQRGVNFAPGAGQLYSNSGYQLLSLAMERVWGRAFEALLEERVFSPLGLRDTESVRNDDVVRSGIADGYVPLPDGGWRRGVTVSEERLGDGAMVSTVDDLLTWLSHLRGSRSPGREPIWREMTERVPLPCGIPSEYGLGLRRRLYRGVEIVGHGGGVMGATSHVLTIPEHGLDVVVLFNRPAPAERFALRIVDAVLGDDVLGPVPPRPLAADLGPLAGWYGSAGGAETLLFSDAGNHAGMGAAGASPSPLEGIDLPGFLPFAAQTEVGPVLFRPDGGLPLGESIQVFSNGRLLRFERLKGEPPSIGDLAAEAAGTYVCEDVEARVKLHREGGRLSLACRGAYGWNTFRLDPVRTDLLVARHALMPFSCVVRLLRTGRAVTGLTMTTGRTLALPFERTA